VVEETPTIRQERIPFTAAVVVAVVQTLLSVVFQSSAVMVVRVVPQRQPGLNPAAVVVAGHQRQARVAQDVSSSPCSRRKRSK
jgi:hypothetical protein